MIAKLEIRRQNGSMLYQSYIDARSGNLPKMFSNGDGTFDVQGLTTAIVGPVVIEVTFSPEQYKPAIPVPVDTEEHGDVSDSV